MHALREVEPVAFEVPSSGGKASNIGNLSVAMASALGAGSVAVSQSPKRLTEVNPLEHSAWDSLLSAAGNSSFFHSTAWARVLHDTYGHRPFYFCRFEEDKLQEVLPLMEVSSLLTGRRGISLPFTDFCFPLTASTDDRRALYEQAIQRGQARGWRYLECRGDNHGWQTARPSLTFLGHVIDLLKEENAMSKNLDGAVRRGISKARKAGLQVDFSTNTDSMSTFVALHCQTRRRHGLPPQPFRFFRNIARHVLAKGNGFVATARLDQRPIAAAVFFHHRRQVLYKFGASDYGFQHVRPNNLLMWEAVRRCARDGFESLHLGRTSISNEGLRRFKLGFGAHEEKIQYYKFDFLRREFVTDIDRTEVWFTRVFRFLPVSLLRLAGQALYPHLS